MHVLDPDRAREQPAPAPTDHENDGRDHDGAVIDLTPAAVPDDAPTDVNVPPRRGLMRVRGMRVRRIRIGSVAKIGAVFFALGYAVVLASAVLAWSLATRLGLITDVEELVINSLGVDTFEVAGGALFEVFALVAGVLAVFAFVTTILLALVYNAACAVLGGVALETGPLRRPRRVFSLRHRRFVTIS